MADTETTYKDLFETINQFNGISNIWIKVLDMLSREKEYSDSSLQVLCLYFSFIDDGNICIPLNSDLLVKKWNSKWDSLISGINGPANNPVNKSIIDEGIQTLLNPAYDSKLNNLFVIREIDSIIWLFTKKYYDAKLIIEDRINIIFSCNSKRHKLISEKPLCFHSRNTPDAYQKEAIRQGMENNLIITGGPGTGKTTVVYDILKNILIMLGEEFPEWNYYITAPTGKAADRLSKNLLECLEKDSGFNDDIIKDFISKLAENNCCTIHRLLKYSPQENKFRFDGNEHFPQNSIFVIDEASMIDICLFSSLLNAIPDEAIVFILGDKNQLPSVDAGAVLGEVLGLKKNTDFSVELEICHRDDSDSQDISKAAKLIISNDSNPDKEDFISFIKSKDKVIKLENPENEDQLVGYYCSDEMKKSLELAESFFIEKKEVIDQQKTNGEKSNAEIVFGLTEHFKILCAERKGPRGVESINKRVIQLIKGKEFNCEEYYSGELLMITKNNPILKLYNGDDGVVIKFPNDNTLWFMIKKGRGDDGEERNGIFTRNGFTYYPLYLIPSDSIEVSYAITIHKSQGSGYDDIMIFLPDKKGHPLLNRQILYTALTRAKKHATIVASEEAIREAISKKIKRDTKIDLLNMV